MNVTDRFEVSPEVMAQEVGDEIVLLDLRSGTYLGLDAVGSRIWQLIQVGRSLDEICEELLRDFEVSREDVSRDTVALLEELKARSIVTPKVG